MKTYQVMMSDSVVERVPATSASDAIQSALIKNPGKTVKACSCRDASGNGMDYEIPPHRPLSHEDIARMKPKRVKPEAPAPIPGVAVAEDKPAPWIQDWMDSKKNA